MKLFVYGTLKSGRVNNYVLNGCEFVDRGYVLGELYVSKITNIPFLLDGNNFVYGELYDITKPHIADFIRRFETGYTGKDINVVLDNGEEVKAIAYLYDYDGVREDTQNYKLIREY